MTRTTWTPTKREDDIDVLERARLACDYAEAVAAMDRPHRCWALHEACSTTDRGTCTRELMALAGLVEVL